MKTTFSRKLSTRLCAGLLLLGCIAGTDASVLTSFETDEGFTAGSRTNTAGWTLSSTTQVRVSNGVDEPAFDGDLSLRMEKRDSGTWTAIPTGWVDAAEENHVYSFSFTNPTATWANTAAAAWIYITLQDGDVTKNIRLYATFGNTAAADYRIRYDRDNGSGEVTPTYVTVAPAAMDFTEWNTITADFDFEAKTYTLSLNGLTLATDIGLPSDWNPTAIVGTWLVSPSTGIVYYDAIGAYKAIPESSTLGMLGLGAVLLVGWNARRRGRLAR